MGDDGVSRVLSLKVEAVLEQPAEEVLAHGP
jgi:hypothetical protein